MQLKIKLYAGLQDYLPRNADSNATVLDVEANCTVYQVIDSFSVPRNLAHLVLLNGVFVEPTARDHAGLLNEGDTLAIWPPVAGG